MDLPTFHPGHDRVRDVTSFRARERIDQLAQARLHELASAGPVAIGRQLERLDREWDLDRALMANFALVGGFTFFQGIRRVRPFKKGNGWLYFFSSQLGFMLMHALVGWCPPSIVFRRMGIRTSKEIAAEREALEKMLLERSQTAQAH